MEIEFKLSVLQFSGNDAKVSVRAQPSGLAPLMVGGAWVEVSFNVLTATPANARTAPSLQAIGDAALAQARSMLDTPAVRSHLQRWAEEEQRRDVSQQLGNLGLPM